jgi:undecaprenyl-diphosphatase
VITRLGSAAVLAPLVALTAAFLWRRGVPRRAVFLVVTASVGSVLNSAVKLIVHRSRPVVPYPMTTALGKSFPSGHTVAATACFGAMLIALLPILPQRWRVPSVVVTLAVVLAVGASRVLLGVHFFTDVVAGFILGTAWLAASTAAFQIWRAEARREDRVGQR